MCAEEGNVTPLDGLASRCGSRLSSFVGLLYHSPWRLDSTTGADIVKAVTRTHHGGAALGVLLALVFGVIGAIIATIAASTLGDGYGIVPPGPALKIMCTVPGFIFGTILGWRVGNDT